MRGIPWRHPLLMASVLPHVNRWHHGTRWYRLGRLVTGAALLCAMAVGIAWVADDHPSPAQSVPAWLPGLGFAGVAAAIAFGLVRKSARRHGTGWMQAWPFDGRVLARWLCIRGGLFAFACMAWPAWLAGSVWVADHGVWLVLAGSVLGAMLGAWVGNRWLAPGETCRDAAVPLAMHGVSSSPFLGLAQLQCWQRQAIGRVGLRRWGKWVGLLLLSFPSASIGFRGVIQILLPLLLWPLYARAMGSSLSTVQEASRLLAATPLPLRAWLRRLLPLPGMLAMGLAAAVAIDLFWMHWSLWIVVVVALSVLMVEGWRVGHCCWRCRSSRGVDERWHGGIR